MESVKVLVVFFHNILSSNISKNTFSWQNKTINVPKCFKRLTR